MQKMKVKNHFRAMKFNFINSYSSIVDGNYFYSSNFYILSIGENALKSPLSIQFFNFFIR